MNVTGTKGVYRPGVRRDRIDELLEEAKRLIFFGPPPASFAHQQLNRDLHQISMHISDILAVTNPTTVWRD